MTAEPDNKRTPDQIWQDDQLDRRMVASSLTQFVIDEEKPRVICLNGRWGAGKTFLLQRWREELECENFRAIYFNAWEDDFCDDPFVALIGQLANNLKGEETEEQRKSLVEKAKTLFPIGVSGILSLAGMDIDVAEAVKQMRMAELDHYKENSKNRKKLKNELIAIAKKVHEKTKHPLVFIVDELDRCRPTFAVELLERVKHIFDVPKMVFVIGANRRELITTIASLYGGIDSDVYLRRFFDITLTLPDPDATRFARHLIQRDLAQMFCEGDCDQDASDGRQDVDKLQTTFAQFLASSLDRSLRDIAHCIQCMNYVEKNTKNDQKTMHPHALATLIVLRLINPTLYQRLAETAAQQTIDDAPVCTEILDFLHTKINAQEFDQPFALQFDIAGVEAEQLRHTLKLIDLSAQAD